MCIRDSHKALHAAETLVTTPNPSISGGVAISVDLSGFDGSDLVGYRAKRHTGLIDVDKLAAHEVLDFWEPVYGRGRKDLVLDPGEFYILASKEAVRVPPDHAAEMTPFDPLVGEFRVHYAGFFDPGFGAAEAGGSGARAVLEAVSYTHLPAPPFFFRWKPNPDGDGRKGFWCGLSLGMKLNHLPGSVKR